MPLSVWNVTGGGKQGSWLKGLGERPLWPEQIQEDVAFGIGSHNI